MDSNTNLQKEKRCYVKILQGTPGNLKSVYYKNDFTVRFLIRWTWYFEYRAALFKIESPRLKVEYTTGSYDYKLPLDIYLKRIKNRITAKKGKVTQFTRRLSTMKSNWNQLFPIEEHPKWIQETNKLERLKAELQELQEEQSKALNKNNNAKI